MREDGLILTNAHVVGHKPEVTVKLHDGRSFTGIVQAVDRVSDLATVKIQAVGAKSEQKNISVCLMVVISDIVT